MKQLLLLAVLAALFAVPVATAASTGPSVVASPSTVVAGQTVNITGCGYPGNKQIALSISNGPYFAYSFPTTDPDGCYATTWTAPAMLGDYYVLVSMKSGSKQASTYITVT